MSTTTTTTNTNTKTSTTGRFIWHDLISPDPKAALAFYSELFGWKPKDVEMGGGKTYTLLSLPSLPSDNKDVGGAMSASDAKGIPPHWNRYFTVPNVDASVKQIVELGGKVLAPAVDIPNVGRFAMLTDPQGASFSLLTPTDEKPEVIPPPAGEFCWVELHTDDVPAALAFYKQVFGWSEKASSTSGSPYTEIVRNDGKPVGGMMTKKMPGPNAWLSYVAVASVEASSKRAAVLRGKIIVPPTEIPNMGAYSVLQDPTGATIGLFGAK